MQQNLHYILKSLRKVAHFLRLFPQNEQFRIPSLKTKEFATNLHRIARKVFKDRMAAGFKIYISQNKNAYD